MFDDAIVELAPMVLEEDDAALVLVAVVEVLEIEDAEELVALVLIRGVEV